VRAWGGLAASSPRLRGTGDALEKTDAGRVESKLGTKIRESREERESARVDTAQMGEKQSRRIKGGTDEKITKSCAARERARCTFSR